MAFKPYPIVATKTGLQNNLEPWLLPQDAFTKLENAYLYHAYITKRKGYTLFGSLSTNPVTGIYMYFASNGTSELLAMDTTSLYKYDGTQFNNIASGVFTGDEKDYFWAELWADKMVMTNNHDLIKKYDGTNLTNLCTDSGLFTGGTNYVTKALFVIQFKEHLIAFNTYETDDGFHPQRARWSKSNNMDIWDESNGGGYVDADTTEWITSVVFLKNRLMVWFERSVWELQYTGDPFLPFKWLKIDASSGCYAPFSSIDFSDEIMAISGETILTCNGFNTESIIDKIPEFVLNINPDEEDRAYSCGLDELRQVWWAYPHGDSTRNNKILVFNYRDNNFAVFDMPASSFGFWNRTTTPTWDEYAASYPVGTTLAESADITWDDKTLKGGYPITLLGDYGGKIYWLDHGGDDNGDTIPLDITTKRLNPFYPYKKSVLGYVDFLVSTHPSATVTVDLLNNTGNVPVASRTLDFTGSGEKVWKRLFFNQVANFHTLHLHHNQANATIKIHAIVPFFKAGGLLG